MVELKSIGTLILTILCLAKCNNDGFCSSKDEGDMSADCRRTKVVRVVRGRLGNHIAGYLYNLGMALNFDVEVLVTTETHDVLSRYFKNLRFQPAACGFQDYYKQLLLHIDMKILEYLEKKFNKKIELERGQDGRMVLPHKYAPYYPTSTDSLIAEPGFFDTFHPNFTDSCQWEVFVEEMAHLDDIRWKIGRFLHVYPGFTVGLSEQQIPGFMDERVQEEFFKDLVFHDKFLGNAQKILNQIQSEHLKNHSKKKKKLKHQLTFVGVHWRLTDHIQFEKRLGQKPLTISYFLESMDKFRKKFKNVAFVLVSDDMEYVRERMSVRNNYHDMYFGGNGKAEDPDSIGYDLALLASCNHTILSYGTFSHYAGAFSNGLRIIPEHYPEYRRPQHKDQEFLFLDPLENPMPRLF